MPSVDVPLLEMKGITKSFPGVRALQDVSLEVSAGEVHALVGENGAGKSTLIRILGGIYPRDAGQILLRGLPVEVASPTHARQLGISIIHQELNQVPALSVAENIFLGREPRRVGGLVDWDEMYARAGRLLADLGVSIDPRRRLGTLTVAEQQLVEIAKALSADAAIVVMDEPTAPLTVQGFFRDVSFILRHGEILGIAGLICSGKAEVAHAIFGATSLDAGEILLDGRPVSIRSPADAIALGIGLVTEDRKRLGLVLSMSVRANITLPIVRRLAVALFIRRLEETALITQAIRDLDMAGASPGQIVRNLSGGAQAKGVGGKWAQARGRGRLLGAATRRVEPGAEVASSRVLGGRAW